MITQPQPDIRLPKTPAVQQYITAIRQFTSASTNPEQFTHKNTLNATNWIRSAQGYYTNLTQTNWNENIHIQTQGDWTHEGTSAIPLIDNNATLKGYYTISPLNTGNKIQIIINVVDLTGTNTDLFDLIGESIIYLPEIKLYT